MLRGVIHPTVEVQPRRFFDINSLLKNVVAVAASGDMPRQSAMPARNQAGIRLFGRYSREIGDETASETPIARHRSHDSILHPEPERINQGLILRSPDRGPIEALRRSSSCHGMRTHSAVSGPRPH